MTRITFILILTILCQTGFCQDLKLDSIENYVSKKYYKSLDDHFSLLSRDNRKTYYGHQEIINLINKDSICRNLSKAIKPESRCTRLELINQTHLKYCKGIKKAENLEYLNISYVQTEKWGNYIREIPHEVYDLTKLKVLIVDNTNLKIISHEIGNLTQLEFLSASHGKLTAIPKEIGELEKLVALDLSFNQIDLLPDDLSKLKNLKYLNLAGNSLKYSIDEEIQNLKNLEFISIEFSKDASNIKQTIQALTQLPNLKILHLRYSNLDKLPIEFKNFKSLEQLSLRGNFDLELSSTFETLAKIQSLKILDLSFSRIESLPDEFGLLKNVETIYLGNWKWCCPMIDFFGKTPYNDIHKLPKTAKELDSLKNLYLWTWDVTEKEKEKITKLLPNTNIEFDSKRPDIESELMNLKEKEK